MYTSKYIYINMYVYMYNICKKIVCVCVYPSEEVRGQFLGFSTVLTTWFQGLNSGCHQTWQRIL